MVLGVDQLEAWLSGDMPVEVLASLDYECVGESCGEPYNGSTVQLALY